MNSAVVADEMFPEGVVTYMEIEERSLEDWLSNEARLIFLLASRHPTKFNKFIVNLLQSENAGGSSALLMDLAANEKSVHRDFYNDFEDLFDDDDLS